MVNLTMTKRIARAIKAQLTGSRSSTWVWIPMAATGADEIRS